jgi:spore germination protein PF
MSAIPFQIIIDVVNGGVVNFGGALYVNPKNAVKSNHGSGTNNTGIHIVTVSGVSSTNSLDADAVDQPIVDDI